MRDPLDLLTADGPLAPDDAAALREALAADPALAADARRFDALGRHVRATLDARLPDLDVLVLHALADVPGALSLDEQARLTAADVPGALDAHPGVAAVAERLAADRAAFEAAWDTADDSPEPAAPAATPVPLRATRAGDRAALTGPRRTSPLRWVWRAAAVAAVAAFAVVALRLQQRDAGWATVTASADQTLTLPDGSTALLAAGSRLRIPGAGVDPRQARLEHGSALFRVVHDPSAPFTVETPNAEVMVLGTTFRVTAEQSGAVAETDVVLVEGAVTLAPKARPDAAVRLAPGTGSRVVNLDAPSAPARADVAAALAIVPDVEVRDARADEVARLLAERYGVSVTVEPALAGERVSGTFADGAPDAVAKLALALGARAERTRTDDGRDAYRIAR